LFQHNLFESDTQAAITSVLETIEDELRGGVDGVSNAGQYSGSTMALALLRGGSLLTANIGDSRIVLARQRKHKHHHHHHRERSSSTSSHRGDKEEHRLLSSPDMVAACGTSSPPTAARHKHSHRLAAHQLTNDHKPDQRDEHARILSCGGRVFSVRYESDGVVGPPRVWLGSSNSPGLAMSRSLGDFVVHQVGVLSTPEFCETRLDPSADCFLVLASDGLWDVLSNAEVIAMVDCHLEPHEAVRALLAESHKRWILQEEMSDDTSICVVYLKPYVAAGVTVTVDDQ
jgi:serine/threonine protein phosphatase PrpC